jgi:hypothetical protein
MANKATIFRIAFGGSATLALLFSLLGIMFTGPVVVSVRALELDIQASPAAMHATVHQLTTQFSPRDHLHPEILDQAAEWIAEQMAEAGLAVEFQEYDIDGQRYRNVIGFQPGSQPDHAVYVVGAHYDSFGGFAGADDNASGIAVLLELARTRPQQTFRGGTYYVAFSTEEFPFFGTNDMGSYRFAETLASDGVEVELMLALDSVGYYSDNPGSQHWPFPLGLYYPGAGEFIAIIGDTDAGDTILRVKRAMRSTETLPVYSFRAPRSLASVDLSDHLSFWRFGFPAVLITDTGFKRYPHYHTRHDTTEELDYQVMAQLVHALQGVLWDPETTPVTPPS